MAGDHDKICSPPQPTIAAFRTDRVVDRHVAPATQPQARNARVSLDTHVLNHARPSWIMARRADQLITVLVVLTHAAVAAGLSRMAGTAQVVATLLSAVARERINGPFKTVHGRHHTFQHRVENRPCVFGIPVCE